MHNYPDLMVDQSKKNKKWIAQYIKAAYDEFQQLYPNGFFRAKDKYNLIDQYMKGRQPISKYKRLLDPMGQKNQDKSWLKIDWSILPIVPKFRRMAVEILNKKPYDLQADVVDPLGMEDKEKYFRVKEANIMIADALKKQGMEDKIKLLGMQDDDPVDLDELKMHKQYGYKHQYAVEMEVALDLVLKNHNDFDYIREKLREDFFDFGAACVKEYIDENGYIKLRRSHIKEMLVGFSEYEDFRDARHIGELRMMTIQDIAREAKGELSPDALEEIANQHHGRYRNPDSYEGSNYMNYRIMVLDLEFSSVNHMTLEKRVNKYGNKVVGKAKPKRKSNNKYSSSPYKVVYKGKWVVGTEYFYDCGLATDMKRAKNNLSETTFSYHMIAPQMTEMQTYSLGEQLIAIADQIQIAWYKLQNAIIRARPAGIAIEIHSLQNVPLGAGGKQLEPLEIMDLFYQRGDMVFRGVDDRGTPLPYKPFEQLPNGIGQEAERWFNVIQGHMQSLRDILGFNEITDGSTPDPRTLKGVANLSTQSTNNSIAFINRAEKKLVQNLANDLTLRVHSVLSGGKKLEGYLKPLGKSTSEFFSVDKNATRYTYGVSIVDRPSEEQKQRLAVRIEKALDSEQITIADVVFIENFQNINMAEQILAYRVNKNLERKQQEEMQRIQANAKSQQESAMVAENEKRKTGQMMHEFKMQEEMLKGKLRLQEAQIKTGARMQEAQEISTRDLTKKQMEVDSSEYIAENVKKPTK